MSCNRPIRAFSLIEVMIAMVVVAVLMSAALHAVGAAGSVRLHTTEAARANALAQDLMQEITALPYEDPDGAYGSFGPTSQEHDTGNRSLFNDADDYHEWEASPPQHKDGTPIAGYQGWTRRVTVERIGSQTHDSGDTGLKLITVEVLRGQRRMARLLQVRTRGWDESLPDREHPSAFGLDAMELDWKPPE